MTKFTTNEEVHHLAAGAVGAGKEPQKVTIIAVEGTEDAQQLYRVRRMISGYEDVFRCYESSLSKIADLPRIKEEAQRRKEQLKDLK